MSDVFISYSRKNSAFARRLIDRLSLANKDAWVDWEGIPLTAPNWWAEIKAGIDGADSFVFILSPDSMASVVCNMELDYAIELRKRIVPVVYVEVVTRDAFASIADFQPDEAMEERLAGKDPLLIARDNWQRLSHINWVFFRDADDFDAGFETLVKTVETDLEYVKAHTRYLVRAQEWQRENQRADLLLFGGEIDRAEAWLQKGEGNAAAIDTDKVTVVNPLPDNLHREYIRVSRQADRRRRRLVRSAQLSIAALIGVLIAGLVIGSSIVAQTQQQAAEIEATSAQNVALAETQAAGAVTREADAVAAVADANRQLATATQALVTATHIAEQAADGQATLSSLSTQVVVIEATVTEAAIVQQITSNFANIMLQERDDPSFQIASMNLLVQRYPEHPRAWHTRALVYAEQGRMELAILDYSEAIRLDPEYAMAYENRGNAKGEQEDLLGAIADYDEAIRLDPDNANTYYNRAVVKTKYEDIEGAIADYDEAIRRDPGNPVTYTNRGAVKVMRGDIEGATADYNEAIRLDPGYVRAYTNRGNLKVRQGNIQGAIEDFDKAIHLDPDASDSYYNRGVAKALQGDIEGAIADYSEAIRLNPDDAEAYNNRGNLKFDQGERVDAITDLNEAIRLDPSYARAFFNRGNAKLGQGDIEGAIADYDEAIRLEPNFVFAYGNRGVAKAENDDIEGAITDYDEAIRLDPSYARAFLNRGNAYYVRSKWLMLFTTPRVYWSQALSDWREAERLRGSLPQDVLDIIAEIEAELGITPTPAS